MKRTLTGIAAAALVMSALTPAAFANSNVNYSDISGNFAQQDIIGLSNQGFIHGYSDGTFRPNDVVTRGQFLAYFLNVAKTATGVQPGAHKQYYKDIPARNWDYNYIGAAYEHSWINRYWLGIKPGGIFNENYEASWGDAASFYVAAMESAGKLKPSDLNGMSPLAYCKSIGLYTGIPTASLPAKYSMYLNRASAAVVLYNIMNKLYGTGIPAGSALTLSGSATMAANTNEQLTVVLKDPSGNVIDTSNAQVKYTSDSPNAFVSSGGQLVVTTAGVYHITATVDGITSAPLTVTVAGAASGLKLTAASPTIVADSTATDTITATVVDVNGNLVSGYNGMMEFRDTNGQLVGANGTVSGDVTSVPVVNGVATIQVKSTSQLGASDTITGLNVSQTGGGLLENGSNVISSSLSVTQQPQIATSLKVVPTNATVENNVPSEDGFTVQVLDQSGQPMLSGVYSVNLAVTGSGKLDQSTPTSTAYVGNNSTSSAVQGNIWSEQGVTGPITIIATSQGLATGTAVVQSLVVGSPVAVRAAVDASSSSTIVAGSAGGVFDLSTSDQSGNQVTDVNNTGFKAVVLQGTSAVASNIANVSIQGNKAVVTGTVAGSYVLQVTSSDGLTAANVPFVITAGLPSKAVITSPSTSVDLPIGSNTTTVVAQLQDAFGNTVSEAGVSVEFIVATHAGSDVATLGGTTSGILTLTTGSNGQVSVPFVGSHSPGDLWTVGVDKVNGNSVAQSPVSIKMVGGVPTTMRVGLQDTVSANTNNPVYLKSTTTAQAGDTVTVTISPTDSYGNPSTNGDLIQVQLPAGLVNPIGLTPVTGQPGVYTAVLPTNGILTFNATAAQAGGAQILATDLSVGNTTLQGGAEMTIVQGTAVGAALFNNYGEVTATNPVTVQPNVPVQLWLRPVDAEGNAVIEGNAALTYTLGDGKVGGAFRTSASGANVTSLQLPAGTSGIPVFYVNSNLGSYTLTATVQP